MPAVATTSAAPAASSTTTATTSVADRPLHERCLDRARFGDPPESPYLLPFPPGTGYTMFQGYCTENSSHENQLAYDFLMPIGTEVTAARAGTVIDVKEDVTEGSNSRFLNYVSIRHVDGTIAFYAHLTTDGVLVELWDTVEAGQVIVLSGATGRTHEGGLLHFGVYGGEPVREGWDVPVSFRNAEGSLDDRGGLRAGSFYLARRPDG
jgi:murein DD-endopeptidase MepM/ murein hydrolase activator NlpD